MRKDGALNQGQEANRLLQRPLQKIQKALLLFHIIFPPVQLTAANRLNCKERELLVSFHLFQKGYHPNYPIGKDLTMQ